MKDLIASIKKLPQPKNYFSGKQFVEQQLPQNILFFHRESGLEALKPGLHSRFILIVSLSGKGSVVLDGRVFPLREGQMILVYPHQLHAYSDVSKENLTWLFITFELEGIFRDSHLFNEIHDVNDYMFHTLQMCLHEYHLSEKGGTCSKQLPLGVCLLLDSFLSAKKNIKEQKHFDLLASQLNQDEKFLQKVLKTIHDHMELPLQLEDIARELHLSKSYVRSRFKKLMPYSIGDYIIKTKIHLACSCLASGKFTIAEISQLCGFQSIYSFSRCFKKQMSCSPTEYGKRNRE